MNGEHVLNLLKAYDLNCDESQVKKVLDLALQYYGSYNSYPFEIAQIIIAMRMRGSSLVAALLYSISKKTKLTFKAIKYNFNLETAQLFNGILTLSQVNYLPYQDQTSKIFKLLLSLNEDVRLQVLLIKLSYLLHEVSIFDSRQPFPKQQLIATEIIEIYIPLLARMGIDNIRTILQDLCFKILQPDIRISVLTYLQTIYPNIDQLVNNTINKLQHILHTASISIKLTYRIKSLHSIRTKVIQKSIDIAQLHDIIAFRIIVNTKEQCYQVLHIISQHYNTIPGRFKDFIIKPKSNGYQSLHIVIITPTKQKIEIQIRTHEMHKRAQSGTAAHYQYKNKPIVENKIYTPYVTYGPPLSYYKRHNDISIPVVVPENKLSLLTSTSQINLPTILLCYDFAAGRDGAKPIDHRRALSNALYSIAKHNSQKANTKQTLKPKELQNANKRLIAGSKKNIMKQQGPFSSLAIASISPFSGGTSFITLNSWSLLAALTHLFIPQIVQSSPALREILSPTPALIVKEKPPIIIIPEPPAVVNRLVWKHSPSRVLEEHMKHETRGPPLKTEEVGHLYFLLKLLAEIERLINSLMHLPAPINWNKKQEISDCSKDIAQDQAALLNSYGTNFIKQNNISKDLNLVLSAQLPAPELPSTTNIELGEANIDNDLNIKTNIHEGQDPSLYYQQAIALMGVGQFSEAILWFNKVIELKADSIDSHYNKSLLLLTLARYPEAIESINQAIKLNPAVHALYCKQAVALNGVGQYQESIAACDKAIALFPNCIMPYHNKITALNSLKHYDEAVKVCDKIITFSPSDVAIYSAKALILNNLIYNIIQTATANQHEAMECQDIEAKAEYYHRATSWWKLSLTKIQDAIQTYTKMTELKPDFMETLHDKSISLEQLNQLKVQAQSTIAHNYEYEVEHHRLSGEVGLYSE